MPSIVNEFASVLIAGANFEDTGLYALWSKMGVRFEADVGFTDELRYRTHTNGNLATVHFALDRNWSRNLLEQSTDGKSNLERLRDAAKSVVDGREFLWQANKSVPDNFFRGCGQRLPNNPLGLNEFDTVHDMVFMSALNPSPAHAKFLHSRGLILRRDRPARVLRSCLSGGYADLAPRCNRSTPKNIIVPDERLALSGRHATGRNHQEDGYWYR